MLREKTQYNTYFQTSLKIKFNNNLVSIIPYLNFKIGNTNTMNEKKFFYTFKIFRIYFIVY